MNQYHRFLICFFDYLFVWIRDHPYAIDGLVQDCSISIANAIIIFGPALMDA